jgi:hypothetical protein
MGVSGQHHAPAALLPPVPIVQEAGWAPEPVWTQRLEEKSSAPAGNRTPIASGSLTLMKSQLESKCASSFGMMLKFVTTKYFVGDN